MQRRHVGPDRGGHAGDHAGVPITAIIVIIVLELAGFVAGAIAALPAAYEVRGNSQSRAPCSGRWGCCGVPPGS